MATRIESTVTSIDSLEGMSLPGWVYHDPDFFKAEMAAVIRPSWQVVCHVNDIAQAGDWHGLDYLGESIIVIRGDDLKVRAFFNVCRHRASRVVDGSSGCAKKASTVARTDGGVFGSSATRCASSRALG